MRSMGTFTIGTRNSIAEEGLVVLQSAGIAVRSDSVDGDAVMVRSYSLHDEQLPQSVIAVARAGAGVNNIPIDRCTEAGVVVFNTPGANANGVRELTVAGLILSARNVVPAAMWVRDTAEALGEGDDIEALVEKEKKRFVGPELMGKTVAVVGLGAIGVMVANACRALGMDVIGFDPYISVESAWGLDRSIRRTGNLESALEAADYVTLHVPLNDATRGLINSDRLTRMRRGARLLNFARGGLVVDADVLDALDSGRLACYVTDFPNNRLVSNSKVLAIPHLGASTPEAEVNCAVMAAEQLRDYLEFGSIRNSVNFPQCILSPPSMPRLAIANRNVPNMVGQITAKLAEAGLNIADMVNKGRGDVAYTVIDVEGSISDSLVAAISSIDGVIRVRTIAPAG